jgi:hypothetical protein
MVSVIEHEQGIGRGENEEGVSLSFSLPAKGFFVFYLFYYTKN